MANVCFRVVNFKASISALQTFLPLEISWPKGTFSLQDWHDLLCISYALNFGQAKWSAICPVGLSPTTAAFLKHGSDERIIVMEVSGLMSQAYSLSGMGSKTLAGVSQPKNGDIPLMASSLEPKPPLDKQASPSVNANGKPIGTTISVTG